MEKKKKSKKITVKIFIPMQSIVNIHLLVKSTDINSCSKFHMDR